jgi:hydroxyacylglutathione hydrolase
MNLEDHLGDIIRKARMMSNVSSSAAATAAGVSETDLSAMEESGTPIQEMNLTALATLAGLDPAKLNTIASGWLPTRKDPDRWKKFAQFTTIEGMAVNNYLIWDEDSREAALFDTGWYATPAFALIEKNNLNLRHLFITHTHEDHIVAMGTIRAKFPDVRLHSNSERAPAEQRNRADVSIPLGSLRVENRPTPGHAEDGVTYVITGWSRESPPVAIVGDSIFAGSIGRGNQSWDLAKQAVREQVFTLPPATLICPGHGPLTSVEEEKAHNPFF